MSRTGNIPINIPDDINISINDTNLIIKDKTGEQKLNYSNKLTISIKDKQLIIQPKKIDKKTKMIWGTTRSLLNNIILGNANEYKKVLQLVGTGYKAILQGKNLKISAGYSHDIDFETPDGINIKCPDQNTIEISGSNKQQVGEVTAKLRSYSKPEPYKGKGVKYSDEMIRQIKCFIE